MPQNLALLTARNRGVKTPRVLVAIFTSHINRAWMILHLKLNFYKHEQPVKKGLGYTVLATLEMDNGRAF